MQYLFVISGAFSALFSLLLFSKSRKKYEHWFLAVIFLLVTVNSAFVFAFANSTGAYYVPIFSELNYAIPLLYGPLFWFYTKALTTQGYKFKSVDYVHFLPFLLFFAIILVPVFTSYNLPKTQLGYPLIKLVISPFYLFSVIIMIRKYHAKLLEEYSYELEINLIWLNWIVIGGLILWVIGSASYVYNLFVQDNRILLYDYYTLSFLAIYLFALAFVAFRYTDIFVKESAPHQEIKKVILDAAPQEVKTETIEDNDFTVELNKLETLMLESSPYLDPLLTLNKLATLSGIPSYRLSSVLKSSINRNFYDYINKYRVEKVKALLAEGQAEKLSLLGIAMESGFNSKASFNRVFKNMTGKTPTQYLKTLK